jgi:divalent metal cation (Fe/Co/Zn/Cd) transporter
MQLTSLTRFAWLSIAAAVATILLKGWAYLLTGSVGLLSDALESFVNLGAALMALAMLTVAATTTRSGTARRSISPPAWRAR